MNTLIDKPNASNKLFTPLAKEKAATDVRPILEDVEKVFGFVPNLIAALANAPAGARSYLALISEFTKTSFTPQEQQLILLTISVENECQYCTLAHSAAAQSLAHVPIETITAVRNSETLVDTKLNVLVTLTRAIVRQKGNVDPALVKSFVAAGYRKEQIIDLLVGVALKTLSNYFDHLSSIEVDARFQPAKAA